MFAGLWVAAQLGDASRWLEACAAFVAYCAISSAAYLLNDVRDRDDRLTRLSGEADRARQLYAGRALACGGAVRAAFCGAR